MAEGTVTRERMDGQNGLGVSSWVIPTAHAA
jgi:hypothetical protein